MHIQDHQTQSIDFTIDALLRPEIQPTAMSQASAVQESDLLIKADYSGERSASAFNFMLTDVLTPEILKKGGLEAAILLLFQERGDMFDSTLQSRINDTKAGQERMLEQTKERLDQMRESIKEMDKAKKFGTMSEIFGWVGLAASGIAIALTAGAASPLFLAASVGTFAVTTALQVDSATGGHVLKAIAGDNETTQMAVSLAISGLLLIASFGMAAMAATGNIGRNAGNAGKLGKLFGGKGGAGSSTSTSSSHSANQTSQATGNTTRLVGGGADDVANAAQKGGSVPNPIFKSAFGIKNSKQLEEMQILLNNGDHWSQKASQAMVSGLAVAGSVTTIRGAHSRFNATKLSAESMEARAIEKRLSTYMDFIGQVVEDILAQIQGGNRVLGKQLQLAFDPKEAILANV